MKTFGYVYKYSLEENKGILVYGSIRPRWHDDFVFSRLKRRKSPERIVYKYWEDPIIFDQKDCITDVRTGNLVYFEFKDNHATKIERASLANFDKEVLESLIHTSESDYYNDVHIVLENLNTIYDKDKKLVTLPDRISELYQFFGKYPHINDKTKCTYINILDLSLWVDRDIVNELYFGKRKEDIKYLYYLFVRNFYINNNGKISFIKCDNDCLAQEAWSLILERFNDDELKEILKQAPKLQPALPKKFCKNNAELLKEEYGMPDVEICKLYYSYKISNAGTISEYKDIKQRLFVYCHCSAIHLEGEGTPMCQMGKRYINNLKKRLDEQYENVIKQNVISQLTDVSEATNVLNDIQKITPDEFNNVGLFIEKCHALRHDFLGYKVCEKAFESYEKLPQLYKDALKTYLLNCVNESAISATRTDYLSPFSIGHRVEQYSGWIFESTKRQIKKLVNERFSNLDDLKDLNHAYKYAYITSMQYFKRYKLLTKDFKVCQFLKELKDCQFEDFPLTIQWYVVSNIIKQLGYDSLSSFEYVKLDYYDAISDIRSLLKWLDNYGHLKNIVLKKAEERICSVLSDDERWTLFEEKIVKSPGYANIRKRLDRAYKKKYANKELFKHECFQDTMLSDVNKIKDSKVLSFVADNLDSRHQYLMEQKATGFLKLYLWQKNPSGKFDWDLVKSYFHEMSVKVQIRTLRYIFGQMALGESALVVDDLYSEFVETSTPACPAICGVLFILKAKKEDIDISITPAMVESVIGENQKQRFNFLKDSKDFFYPCNGYLAITPIQQDIEYQSFNGILEKEIKDDTLYYVITFHDTPVNLFGRTIEWLDSENVNTAKQVLERNSDIDIVNGKYYIPETQEFFVKQFVMKYSIDDECGLVSNKKRMVELGCLPRNNAYQPLYTNNLRKYEDSDCYVCRCGCEGGSDPDNNLPFYWCKKKICVRRAHFYLPSSKWEEYRFADILFITLGQNPNVRETVWRVNAEISQFICDYSQIFKSSERNISSTPLNESEEKGTWDKDSSTYREIYDDEEYDDEEYNGGDYDDYSNENEKPTYDRYNGSYAQDEMGYSDDDIDTIFDGNPDAYWNID